jgi:hypothetical protein
VATVEIAWFWRWRHQDHHHPSTKRPAGSSGGGIIIIILQHTSGSGGGGIIILRHNVRFWRRRHHHHPSTRVSLSWTSSVRRHGLDSALAKMATNSRNKCGGPVGPTKILVGSSTLP